jgi:hypothetical protein
MQMPQGNPLLLSYTLQELLAKDTVQVELIPEKKGLFLKHVEYEVSSQVTGTQCAAGRATEQPWAGGRTGLWLALGCDPVPDDAGELASQLLDSCWCLELLLTQLGLRSIL